MIGQGPNCEGCGVPLARSRVGPSSRLGLTYALRGKWLVNKQHGICIAEGNQTVTLHFGDEEDRDVDVSQLGAPTDLVPESLSPAGRFIHAERLNSERAQKTGWVADRLLAVAGELLASDVGGRRQLADEALNSGWSDIFDWVELTPSEKAWVCAHASALQGELDFLYNNLRMLPPAGYDDRVTLLLPFLPRLRDEPARWLELVDSWEVAGPPDVDDLRALLSEGFTNFVETGVRLLAGPLSRPIEAEEWQSAAGINSGTLSEPRIPEAPAWSAAAAYVRGMGGANLDAEVNSIATLDIALLDDLIDCNALTSRVDTYGIPSAPRLHLQARLRPESLTDDALRECGHLSELARRQFLARDREGLRRLNGDPASQHYEALLDVLEGASPDAERLRPEAVQVLTVASRAREAIASRAARQLPGPILDDPTLWALFAEVARAGDVVADDEDRERAPEFAAWIDVQRLLGLVWEQRWQEASDLGVALRARTQGALAAEVTNLTAFALYQQGRDDDSLLLLEEALDGPYTEALLVNASILAASLAPADSSRHFARIFREASSEELRVAAMERAVSVWLTANDAPTFPQELKEPLRVVLHSNCTFDQYCSFARLAANFQPIIMVLATDPGDARSQPYVFHRARARLFTEDNYDVGNLTKDLLYVYRQVGNARWFRSDWDELVEIFRKGSFVEFGKALGSATFFDEVNKEAPGLLSNTDRLFMLPQAGAHFAAAFQERGDTLSEAAFGKFFFRPAEEITTNSHGFNDGALEALSDNLSRTLFMATFNYLMTAKDTSAKVYNPLTERIRWDQQNRIRIMGRMRLILDKDLEHIRFAEQSLACLQRLRLTDDDHHKRVRVLTAAINDWRDETLRLRSNL